MSNYTHGTVLCPHCKQILQRERCTCTGVETRGNKYCIMHKQFFKNTTWYNRHKECKLVPTKRTIQLKSNAAVAEFATQNQTMALKFVMETPQVRAEIPLYTPVEQRALWELKENTLAKKMKQQVLPVLNTWFRTPVISTFIAKQKETKEALEPYVHRREMQVIEKYRQDLRMESDNNAIMVNKGLGASMSAFGKQRHLLAYETNAEKRVRIDDSSHTYNIKKNTKEMFTNNPILIDLLFQFVNAQQDIRCIVWINIRNQITKYFDSHESTSKEQWVTIANQSNISTTLKYAYIVTCIARYSNEIIIDQLSSCYEKAEVKSLCWQDPSLANLLVGVPHREYILEHIYHDSKQEYPPSEMPRERKFLKRTPTGQKVPTSAPTCSVRTMIQNCLVGVYKAGDKFCITSDLNMFTELEGPHKIFIGEPITFTGMHKHNYVLINGRICDLRTDIISFLALLKYTGILLPQNKPVTINLILWIDNMPCMITSLMKSAWKIIMDPTIFKQGFEKIIEKVHSFMWFWAPEVTTNVGQIVEYSIDQCDRLKVAIVIPGYTITAIPRFFSGDYGIFTKLVGCNTSTCPCCGANLHDLATKLDYLAMITRPVNSFEDIFNFNKQHINKEKGYSHKCLFMGKDPNKKWKDHSFAQLERVEDPLHIIETVLSDIVQHLFTCPMFDKDEFYIHCGEVLHRNNVSKSGMSSSDWRLLFLQYSKTILQSFKNREKDTPEDNSIVVICELMKYILRGMYASEKDRTPQAIIAFAIAAFQLPIYLFTRVGESIMRIHLHTLWIHLAHLYAKIALRTISSDAFERSNHDTKYRAQFSNHKPETAIVEDKIRDHEETAAQIAQSITKRSSESKITKAVQQIEYPNIVLRAEIVQHPVYKTWVEAFLNDIVMQKFKNDVLRTEDTSGAFIFHTANSINEFTSLPLLTIGPALLPQSVQTQQLEAECSRENCHKRKVSMYCVYHECKACCLSHSCCTLESEQDENNAEVFRVVNRCSFHQPKLSVSKPTNVPRELTTARTTQTFNVQPPRIYESQVRTSQILSQQSVRPPVQLLQQPWQPPQITPTQQSSIWQLPQDHELPSFEQFGAFFSQ